LTPASPAAGPAYRPASPSALFFAFNRLALQGFGGVLPVAQRELVERNRWMDKAEFLELLSVGQVLPGPNIVNMALIFGDRFFGWRGAFAALAGLVLAPLAIVLVLAVLVRQGAGTPMVGDALRGMGVVAAGLVLATAVKLAATLKHNVLGWPLCALLAGATAVAIGGLRWPLVAVLAGLGATAWVLAWRRLKDAPA
jgi:chromate transporter